MIKWDEFDADGYYTGCLVNKTSGLSIRPMRKDSSGKVRSWGLYMENCGFIAPYKKKSICMVIAELIING